MLTTRTPYRPHARLATFITLWLVALLWAPACLAAPSQIVERAFVLDPSGQMTLDQARQQPETAYTGALTRLRDHAVVWVRLRVAPPAGTAAAVRTPEPATERLRVIPIWTQSLLLYDPLQRDASGRIARLDAQPAGTLFAMQSLSIPVGEQARDLWLRLEPSGPVYLKAAVLTLEDAATREVLDGILQGVVIGAQAILILLGVVVWMADKKGIGHTMFTKQVLNLMLVLLNADLFLLPVLPNPLPWPEGSGSYVMESLRLLNMAMSLWFFVKVLELLQASRWALKMQRVPLALMAVCLLLLVFGQLALVRKIALVLYLAVPLGLVVGSLACRREPLHPVTGLGLARRGAERLAFGLVLWAAWGTALSGGLYRAQDVYFFAVMAPIAAFSSVGVLLLVGWRHIRADRQRQDEQQHRAELNTLALDFERGERLRQQEFMSMLTHELKAPLSTLGMVIGSATPSASMRHHATLALASMRQVIDHCAQSADIDDASTPPQLVACWLETELALRCDAQADKARIRIAPTQALPSVLADPRMLAVIFNNLLDNALKYSPHGSLINVAIVREHHPQGAVQRVSVANQALAGPLPDAARLFQKYYRGDAVQRISGSGLGLHLSRLLARRQGGDLQYEATALGITFTLVLPEQPAVALA
jgi:signal transduction histidine kinase